MSEHRRIEAIGIASDGLPVDLTECGFCHEEWPCRGHLFELKERYEDLLLEVGRKYPGETRHDTAKRYIREAESSRDVTASCARSAEPNP